MLCFKIPIISKQSILGIIFIFKFWWLFYRVLLERRKWYWIFFQKNDPSIRIPGNSRAVISALDGYLLLLSARLKRALFGKWYKFNKFASYLCFGGLWRLRNTKFVIIWTNSHGLWANKIQRQQGIPNLYQEKVKTTKYFICMYNQGPYINSKSRV